jgi:hypothetical protein
MMIMAFSCHCCFCQCCCCFQCRQLEPCMQHSINQLCHVLHTMFGCCNRVCSWWLHYCSSFLQAAGTSQQAPTRQTLPYAHCADIQALCTCSHLLATSKGCSTVRKRHASNPIALQRPKLSRHNGSWPDQQAVNSNAFCCRLLQQHASNCPLHTLSASKQAHQAPDAYLLP